MNFNRNGRQRAMLWSWQQYPLWGAQVPVWTLWVGWWQRSDQILRNKVRSPPAQSGAGLAGIETDEADLPNISHANKSPVLVYPSLRDYAI